MKTILYVNYWQSNGDIQDRWITKFIEVNMDIKLVEISLTDNQKPDILVSSCFGNIDNIVKYKDAKIKIFFYGENLNRFPPYNNINLLKSFFDVIIGFKYTDKNNKLFRLPLWMTYYDFYNLTDNNNNIITFLEKSYRENIYKNKNNCALIASHDMNGIRTKIYNEVIRYTNVNCPGSFNNNCKKIGNTCKDKMNFLKDYKYNICPENSRFEGYFTEKIFQSLQMGCIPIYWGTDYPEKEILNKQSYCFVDIENECIMKEQLNNLFSNTDSFIVDRLFNTNANDVLHTYYSEIISEIKNLFNTYNVYN